MTRKEAIKRLKVWLICVNCPEEKQCYDSYLHSTCEYTDYCDEVNLEDAIKVAINSLEIDERYELEYENAEDIHREKEQAYMQGYEDASKKYRQEPCEDAISRQAVDTLVDELARAISDERCCISRGRSTATIMQDILDLPPVKPQVICPSYGIDCKDCPAYESKTDTWSIKDVANTFKKHGLIKEQEPILDTIRAEIEKLADDEWNKQVGSVSQGLEDAIEIIDKYKAESEG